MKILSLSSAVLALTFVALGCASAAPVKTGGGTALALVTIIDSGSTNSSGYTVRVYAGGQAEIMMNRPASTRQAKIPRSMASDLFAAIHLAQSNGRPSGAATCMKSASFGSSMRVKYSTWTSPDLNCPVIGANAAVKAQVEKILARLKVHPGTGHFITLPVNEPRRMEGPPAPSASP